MKRCLISVLHICCLALPQKVLAQSAKEALLGLKKLQARVQSGVSYRDYGQALGEAKFPVNLYLESMESSKNPELTDSIKKAIAHYEFVRMVWQDTIDNEIWFISGRMEKLIIASYPIADKDSNFLVKEDVFDIIWGKASDELKIATALFSKEEASSATDIKNEIEVLKSTNEKLQIENTKLREEINKLKERSSLKKK